MRLRKPCEHGKYDGHPVEIGPFAYPDCPGGEFLRCRHGETGGHYVVPDLPLSFPDAPWCSGPNPDQVGEPG